MKLSQKILIGLTAIVITAVSYYEFRNPEKIDLNSAVRQQIGGTYAQLSDGYTYYEEAGPKDGRVILLVHGFSVPSYIWDTSFAILSKSGYRVIRFDLFGRGYSDRPDAQYDGAMYARQINELLATLNISQKVDVVGLSFGGFIGAYYAAHFPEKIRSLSLVDPSNSPAQLVWHRSIPLLGAYLFQVNELPQKAESQSVDFLHPEQYPNWAERYRPQMQYKGFGRALRRSSLRLAAADFNAMYASIRVAHTPVLLVWGKQDTTLPISGAVNVRKGIPDLEFVEIDQAGHLPHIEQPEIFHQHLLTFLQKH
ncbi:alpha/beta fold hydrolase [Undibacterium fentianense]|uniref:Alpha/beta hydrolase n=1 Tax=Undibacterium fentianense TaxID=2828728 RepID=A0A941E3U5_9BURK|nr:alpha/beta hydrolase [Undibacterium fentianense]MBR7801006.1 alpha/beta hydrolase [Undibacterium fentianense]